MTINGDWKVTIDSPMGAQESTLHLTADGGRLSGRSISDQGEQEILDGTFTDDLASWKLKISQPMPMTLEFSGQLHGDDLSGKVKAGMFGSFAFSGRRL